MNSRSLVNLGMFLVLALLALVVYFEPGLESEPEFQALTPLAKADIHQILLQRPEKPDLLLQKTGNIWSIAGDPALPAAEFQTRSLLRLAGEKALRQYPKAAFDLAKIGLDSEAPKVTFNQKHPILFGATDPLDNQRYTLVGEQVLLIQNFYQHLLESGIDLWIDTQLLPINSYITRIETPDFSLQSSPEGLWSISPEQEDISSDRLVQMIQQWQNASATRVLQQTSAAQGKKVSIQLDHPPRTIDFFIEESPEEIIFRRPELGLQYLLTTQSAAALLQLQPQTGIDAPAQAPEVITPTP